MISRKAGLLMIGSALLLGACHKDATQNVTTTDTNVSDTSTTTDSNAAMPEDADNGSNAMMSDDSDNGERGNPDSRGGGN